MFMFNPLKINKVVREKSVFVQIGAINFEYQNIKLKNREIEKQSGELKAKWGTKS